MTLNRKLTMTLLAFAAAGIFAATASAAAPTNTAPPTITGIEQQGKKLTAHNGTWTGAPKFTYRWQRCAGDGTSCGNIDNAAAKTYVLTPADVGHTVRVVVTGTNVDGTASAPSKTTNVISGTSAPNNTVRPSITGTPQPGESLTADNGTWTNGVRTFAYQWQHCDAAGATCTDVAGATGKVYGVRTSDVGGTLRVAVTATNLVGSTTATSDRTEVVKTATTPPPTSTTPAANHRPSVLILSVRWIGRRVYVRMRVCDDSRRNVTIVERDTKPGVRTSVRTFRTLVAPKPCGAVTRSWIPAARFMHGRFTIRLTARDAFGLVSLRTTTKSVRR